MTMLLVISGSSAPVLGFAVADGSGVADGVSRAAACVGSSVGLGVSAGVLVSFPGASMSVLLLGSSRSYARRHHERTGPRCMISSLPSTVTRRSECVVRDCEQVL